MYSCCLLFVLSLLHLLLLFLVYVIAIIGSLVVAAVLTGCVCLRCFSCFCFFFSVVLGFMNICGVSCCNTLYLNMLFQRECKFWKDFRKMREASFSAGVQHIDFLFSNFFAISWWFWVKKTTSISGFSHLGG